jgi:hypothetical protein
MHCPICGGILRDHISGCATCPMHGGSCGMLCCENCGYETVAPRSATVEFFRRLLRRRRRPPPDAAALASRTQD